MKTRLDFQNYLNDVFTGLTKEQSEYLMSFLINGTNVDYNKALKAIDNNSVGSFLKKINKDAFLKGYKTFRDKIVSNIKHGRLYNWYAAGDPLFAPDGWHVPTPIEFQSLNSYLGDNSANKLREKGTTYWDTPGDSVTNESNFFARGSGNRYSIFESLLNVAFFWTNTSGTRVLIDESSTELQENTGENITDGYSVRLIKNDSILVPSLTDLDGNVYRTTKIGDQVWLADNWACTKLNDGTPIPNVSEGAEWDVLITGAYCDYDNDQNNSLLT